ncbi:MAG: hypothetical protein LBU32_08320 [Clostridiales bacterium]|jgi:hypothetical protein|nr:hypothetical protein [Clostridiales bacterium]
MAKKRKALVDPEKKWKTQWHAGNYDALRAELKDYLDVLEIIPEYPLTDEPLRIDVLVIKLKENVTIGKNFARIFKRLNIIEYKSPEDSFTVEDFHKVIGYASILALASEPFTDFSETTVTAIVATKPVQLLSYFKDKGLEVTEHPNGIVTLQVSFPTPAFQIVESKALSGEENLWLKSLSKELTSDEFFKLVDESKKLGFPVRAYFNALMQANPEVLKEVRKLDSDRLNQVLDEVGFFSKESLERKLEEQRLKFEKERLKLEEQRLKSEEQRLKLEEEKEEERRGRVAKMFEKGYSPEEIIDLFEIPMSLFLEYTSQNLNAPEKPQESINP